MTGRSNSVRYLRGKWNRAAQLCTRVFSSVADAYKCLHTCANSLQGASDWHQRFDLIMRLRQAAGTVVFLWERHVKTLSRISEGYVKVIEIY